MRVARVERAEVCVIDADDRRGRRRRRSTGRSPSSRSSRARRASPIAWNLLRQRARGATAVFIDADVTITPDAVGVLVERLDAHPTAALVSAKTTCAPRPTAFERVMAAPYGVDFPNLSAQLYGARLARLPPAMPVDLIEPERWLELIVGRDALVREPSARVQVRLPGDLADFFRQRIRIEMGKVQIARDYAGLLARSAPQPRSRAALRTLRPAELLCLGAYLGLRARPASDRVVAVPSRAHRGGVAAGGEHQALGGRVRVLVLTTRFPAPPWRGDQVRAYHHLRLLAPRHDVTLAALCWQPPSAAARAEVAAFGVRVEVVPLGRVAAVPRLARALLGDAPSAPGAAVRRAPRACAGARAGRRRCGRT